MAEPDLEPGLTAKSMVFALDVVFAALFFYLLRFHWMRPSLALLPFILLQIFLGRVVKYHIPILFSCHQSVLFYKNGLLSGPWDWELYRVVRGHSGTWGREHVPESAEYSGQHKHSGCLGHGLGCRQPFWKQMAKRWRRDGSWKIDFAQVWACVETKVQWEWQEAKSWCQLYFDQQDNADQTFAEELCYTFINHGTLRRMPSGISAEACYENVPSQAKRPRELVRGTETEYSLLRVQSTPKHPPSPENEYELVTPHRISSHPATDTSASAHFWGSRFPFIMKWLDQRFFNTSK